MNTNEEVLAKLLEYKVLNDLPAFLAAVQSEWEGTHSIGTVTLDADPIVGFKASMAEIIISGWDTIDEDELLNRINRFPCAFCFVSEIQPIAIYEQETADELQYLAGIKIVDQGTSRSILEKKIYRYTHATYDMMRSDRFLNGSGWYVENVAKAYAGTIPTQPLLKSGLVGFSIKKASVT